MSLNIYPKYKILSAEDGSEIARAFSLNSIFQKHKSMNKLKVDIKGGYFTKELIVPELEYKDMDDLIAWKIIKSFPQYSRGYYYSYNLQSGKLSNRLNIKFIRSRYIDQLKSHLAKRRIEVVQLLVDGDCLSQLKRKPDQRVFYSISFCLILFLAVIYNLTQWVGIKDEIETMYSKEAVVEHCAEVVASPIQEAVPSPEQLGFSSAAQIQPQPDSVSVTRNSFSHGYSVINDLITNKLPSDMRIKAISYEYKTQKLLFEGWYHLERPVIPGLTILTSKCDKDFYFLTGECYVK